MGEKAKITCDGCGKDITTTTQMPAFRLHLSAECLPNTSRMIYAVLVYPPIESDCYFCDIECLQHWLNHK
jgi:hypothetical protein